MKQTIVQSIGGVTLAGGAPFSKSAVQYALTIAPTLIAADGGANRLLRFGVVPDRVIGDLDSLSKAAHAILGPARLHLIAEQDSTDFDKALRSIDAGFILALGFIGARVDHELAAYNTLVRHAQRTVIMLSARDLVFVAPRSVALDLPEGTRLSLFPMGPVEGESEGLRWPIGGLSFAPGGRVGTSNLVTGPLRLRFDAARMLVIAPRSCLSAVLHSLVPEVILPAATVAARGG